MIFAVSVREPREVLDRACKRAYGSAYEMYSPAETPDIYASAYKVVTKNLREGESLSILDPSRGLVTFYTPKREEKAWSAVVLVIDVRKFLVN